MMVKSYRRLILSFIIMVGLVFVTSLQSVAQASDDVVDVYFFHSKTCPHCLQQKPLMTYIDQHNKNVEVTSLEVNDNPREWQEFQKARGISSGAVPRTVVEDKMFIGYSEAEGPLEYTPVHQAYIGYKNQIIAAIETAVGSPLNLPTTDQQQQTKTSPPWQVFLIPFWYLCSYPFLQKALEKRQAKRYWIGGLLATTIISLFVFLALTPDAVIKTFAQGLPFPLFVSTIALADGFNPCAFTVLVILLSLLTYTRSRKDMTLVGTTFIITSAVMYFIFIMLMVLAGSVFLENYGVRFMQILGILITGAGLINIKDYFWFKKAISLSLSEKQQSTINKRAGKIVRNLRNAKGDRKMFMAALAGTVLLAVFVNIVELGCTAILPAVYMTALLQYCSDEIGLCHISWTGLYAAIYIIPLLAILGNFIYSFKSTRLTENQGRVLKLVGGLFMLFFGLAMIFKPQLLTLG